MSAKISLRQILSVFAKEYVQWLKNPRMIICLGLFVMIREIVVLPMKDVSMQMNQPLNVLEPVIAVANSGMMLLLIPLVYLVIMADFPSINGNTYFYLPRTGRINWMLGQVMFQVVSLLTYILGIILFTAVQVFSDSFLVNGWSLVTLDHDKTSYSIIDDLLPVNLHYQMPPYLAFAAGYLLVFLFLFSCSTIMLLFSLYGRKKLAFWLVMLDIAVGMVFCAFKSKWMWLFPVSHSIIWLHFQDYYREYVFSPYLSGILLILLNVMAGTAAFIKVRRVNLDILREERE